MNENSRFIRLIRAVNEAQSAEELAARLKLTDADGKKTALALFNQKSVAGGVLKSDDQIIAVLSADKAAALNDAVGAVAGVAVEAERAQFKAFLFQNPNYFGNLETSPFKPVKVIQFNTTYEELTCTGLNPPYDRLEAVLQVKKDSGYSGDICSFGSLEYVRFYVDLHDNGVFHDVGMTSVRVHDIPGTKPLCYAVSLDFSSFKKFCVFENIVKVRAILSWNTPPPANSPNYIPVWGNRLDAEVQIQPSPFIFFPDFIKELELAKVKLPDPIGPIVKAVDPESKVQFAQTAALTIPEKRKIYANAGVPPHRFAFAEVKQALEGPVAFDISGGQAAFQKLGLEAAELAGILGKIQIVTDGDTSFEQLKCAGLRPASDLLEAVLTVKKSTGFSGPLCGGGSTEYVGFYMDFGDGSGFVHIGTSTVNVHDLTTIPAAGVQYAVFLKKDLSKYKIPCQAGARTARLRAILSWESAPTGPNYVPVWGNRVECLVQLNPGIGIGHVPVIEFVGDVPVNFIDQGTGLATGHLEQSVSTLVNQSPFGGEVSIGGTIGLPPDVLGGGAVPFKYKVEVSRDNINYHPLTDKLTVSIAEQNFGFPVLCGGSPVCQVTLNPTNDGDGLGDGWYTYLEDTTGLHTRHYIENVLARWQTTAQMEGLWYIKITAKDPSFNPPHVFNGFQVIKVWIDNTAPTVSLDITSYDFKGVNTPATNCSKIPKGATINGTYSVTDPGTTAPDPHFGGMSLDVIPAGPANGATPVPSSISFNGFNGAGVSGTFTLDTTPMDICGYVLRLVGCDRTNYNSVGNPLCAEMDRGFCLIEPPK